MEIDKEMIILLLPRSESTSTIYHNFRLRSLDLKSCQFVPAQETLTKRNNPSCNMEVTLESSLLLAIFTIVGAASLTYLLNKKLDRDRQNLKRKQLASSIYNEILTLKVRLESLPDINSNLSVSRFQTATPIYIGGGISYNLQSDILLFSKELSEQLSKLNANILYLEEYRKRVNRDSGISMDLYKSLTNEFQFIKTTFNESVSLIQPILEMLEKEKV